MKPFPTAKNKRRFSVYSNKKQRSIFMSWNQQSFRPQQQPGAYIPSLANDERVGAFLAKVYGWMFLGLLVTALVAFAIASTPGLIELIFATRIVFWVLVFAQLGMVFYLSARVNKVQPATAGI